MNIPPQAYQLMALHLQEIIKTEGASDGLGDQAELLYKIADIIGEKAVKEYEQKSLQIMFRLSTLPPWSSRLSFRM